MFPCCHFRICIQNLAASITGKVGKNHIGYLIKESACFDNYFPVALDRRTKSEQLHYTLVIFSKYRLNGARCIYICESWRKYYILIASACTLLPCNVNTGLDWSVCIWCKRMCSIRQLSEVAKLGRWLWSIDLLKRRGWRRRWHAVDIYENSSLEKEKGNMKNTSRWFWDGTPICRRHWLRISWNYKKKPER